MKWRQSLGVGGGYTSRFSVALGLDGTVFAPQIEPGPSGGVFYALDPADGSPRWPAPGSVDSVVAETSPYVGPDGTVYYCGTGFAPDDGAVRFHASPVSVAWGYWGSTLDANGVVLCGGPGDLQGVAQNDASLLWDILNLNPGGGGVSAPIIDADGVYFGGGWGGSATGVVYVTSPTAAITTLSIDDGVFDAPAPGPHGELYVGAVVDPSGGALHAFAPP
jgi:hypothetical protein